MILQNTKLQSLCFVFDIMAQAAYQPVPAGLDGQFQSVDLDSVPQEEETLWQGSPSASPLKKFWRDRYTLTRRKLIVINKIGVIREQTHVIRLSQITNVHIDTGCCRPVGDVMVYLSSGRHIVLHCLPDASHVFELLEAAIDNSCEN
ncbi:hypothetical protein P9112_009707 [Eukaryota sp. TZLM1-RC]